MQGKVCNVIGSRFLHVSFFRLWYGILRSFTAMEDPSDENNSSFFFGAMILFGIGCAASLSSPIADPRADRERMSATDDPGCTASTLVSTGGAFPKDSRTLAIRWTGYTNYELAYNGQIILLDAHFDRGSMFPPLGFTAADIKRANVILLGHGHLDHMSDAASVGARTGAIVVGAPVTTDKLKTQAIDPKQIRTVTGSRRRTARISRIQSRTDSWPPR